MGFACYPLTMKKKKKSGYAGQIRAYYNPDGSQREGKER